MRKTVSMVSAAVLVASVAACSSTGGRKATEESNLAGGHANTPRMTVALITHSAPGDTFWDIVRKGAEDAAAKDNVTLQYSADPDGLKQSNLVQQAIDKKVDGIAVTLSKPDAMRNNVKQAVSKGIPVVALNGGADQWKSMGVLSFFGQDEKIAGEAAGEKLKAQGRKKAICVIHEQGNVGLESRCKGVQEKFPNTQLLYVNGTDMPSVQSGVTSKLQQDPSIDSVLTLGGPAAMASTKSVKDANSKANVYTFDTSKEVINAIKDGSVQWAVDQQPYLQGYLAVDSLWLNKNNGDEVGGGQPVLTGPAFIDKSNVGRVEKFAAAGRR